jgi:hypothetical protein
MAQRDHRGREREAGDPAGGHAFPAPDLAPPGCDSDEIRSGRNQRPGQGCSQHGACPLKDFHRAELPEDRRANHGDHGSRYWRDQQPKTRTPRSEIDEAAMTHYHCVSSAAASFFGAIMR